MSGVVALDKLPFTIDCLPFGVVTDLHNSFPPQCAIAIGDHALVLTRYLILDLRKTEKTTRPWEELEALASRYVVNLHRVFAQSSLNAFAALPLTLRQGVRRLIQQDLKEDGIPSFCFLPLADLKVLLPMDVTGFSDFYTSLEHCQNCSGEMSSSAIAKNWWYAPSCYNSRASSLLPTPSNIPRPVNVSFKDEIDSQPIYGPSKKIDFELEMGFFISKPVEYGETMSIKDAREHIFGFVLLNDWSARDHQLFEMRPLGPFHSKGFGTSISNWVVPLEALDPFSCQPYTKQDPPPFEHLTWPTPENGAFDIKLKAKLLRNGQMTVLGTSNLKYLYWTPYQQITHHAASGCGLMTGDLIGTGTISGSGVDEAGMKFELGCLYEAERLNQVAVPRGSGKYHEGYLDDGDEIILEGWCEDSDGKVVFGFGECRGRIIPPR